LRDDTAAAIRKDFRLNICAKWVGLERQAHSGGRSAEGGYGLAGFFGGDLAVGDGGGGEEDGVGGKVDGGVEFVQAEEAP